MGKGLEGRGGEEEGEGEEGDNGIGPPIFPDVVAPMSSSTLSHGRTFSKLLRKILGKFLILGQSLTISGKASLRMLYRFCRL